MGTVLNFRFYTDLIKLFKEKKYVESKENQNQQGGFFLENKQACMHAY